uniref:Uncharacterized protein n=1 Tax=Arsenophonus nasoniae TaxID=638 RepID=D2U4J1_9GAMM|nr:hypothetical protein ARN_36100 [Arsenophonus nasoniae]
MIIIYLLFNYLKNLEKLSFVFNMSNIVILNFNVKNHINIQYRIKSSCLIW